MPDGAVVGLCGRQRALRLGSHEGAWSDRMSWTIEIVCVPVPDDPEEAWAFLEDLRDEAAEREYGAPPSPELEDLYRRLAARYPCITEDPESPWSDGPLINNFGDKIATLGFVKSGMTEALPFVIATATGMGFTVFDAGDEAIHRPKGWQPSVPWSTALPAEARPWWKFWR